MPTEADLLARLREKNRIIAEQQVALDAYKRQYGPLKTDAGVIAGEEKLITKPFPASTKPITKSEDDLS